MTRVEVPAPPLPKGTYTECEVCVGRGMTDRYGQVPEATGRLVLRDKEGVQVAAIDTCPTHILMSGGRAEAYSFITTEDGDEVQVLLERSTIDEGEWFPNALDDNDDLIPSVANEVADIINSGGILPSRAMKAVEAGKQWKNAEEETNRLALERAKAVTEVVAYCGGQPVQGSSRAWTRPVHGEQAGEEGPHSLTAARTPRLPHITCTM